MQNKGKLVRKIILISIFCLLNCSTNTPTQSPIVYDNSFDDSITIVNNFPTNLDIGRILIDAYREGFFDIDSVLIGQCYASWPFNQPRQYLSKIPNNILPVQSDLYLERMNYESPGPYFTTYYTYEPDYVKITSKARLVDIGIFMKRTYTAQYSVVSSKVNFTIDTSLYGIIPKENKEYKVSLSSNIPSYKYLHIIDYIRNKRVNFRNGFDRHQFPTIYKTRFIDLQTLVSIRRELGELEYRLDLGYSKGSREPYYWIRCDIVGDSLRVNYCGHRVY